MKLPEAKQQFIQTWARLGSEWGINRTMAQVHALLLSSTRSLSTEEVMDELSISRGNANMNIRELINWNLVYRETVQGDRKEYFRAEKDIWEVAKIEPLLWELNQLEKVEDKTAEGEQFVKVIKDINGFANKMNKSVETMIRADESWFFGSIIKLLK